MKIALLGYGRMGKAIEKIAIERGHSIVYKLDKKLNEGTLSSADVAINFSTPETAVTLIKKAMEKQIPVVCGTTGWLEHYTNIENFCQKQKTAFLYASNFSIGVNVFFKLNEILAKTMQQHKEYQTKIDETHHIHKLDAPSGTAITLAEGILKNSDYTSWSLQANDKNTLPIAAKREGEVPGLHTVTYESESDSIQITHNANNRKGFALGAVIASEWIAGKQGVFTMTDVLKLS